MKPSQRIRDIADNRFLGGDHLSLIGAILVYLDEEYEKSLPATTNE